MDRTYGTNQNPYQVTSNPYNTHDVRQQMMPHPETTQYQTGQPMQQHTHQHTHHHTHHHHHHHHYHTGTTTHMGTTTHTGTSGQM